MIMVRVKVVKIHKIVKVKIRVKVKAKAMKTAQVIHLDHVKEEVQVTTLKILEAEPEITSFQEIHNFTVICNHTATKMVKEEVKAHLILVKEKGKTAHLIIVEGRKAHLQTIIHMVKTILKAITVVLQILLIRKILEVIVVATTLMRKRKKTKRQKPKKQTLKNLMKVLVTYLNEGY